MPSLLFAVSFWRQIMGEALKIEIKPIDKPTADKIVKKYHYSGKVVQNSNLNFGVFYNGILLGAMQFGSPMVKDKLLPLVKDAKWGSVLELNRMAFSDALPRFGESRALSLAFKWIKKNAPQVEWIVSFADGTQCGHGTIYQASNFYLTQIKKNSSIILLPSGETICEMSLRMTANADARKKGYKTARQYLDAEHKGWRYINGYMYRYIYFLTKNAKKNFQGEFIPYSKIKEIGAEMVRGEWVDSQKN